MTRENAPRKACCFCPRLLAAGSRAAFCNSCYRRRYCSICNRAWCKEPGTDWCPACHAGLERFRKVMAAYPVERPDAKTLETLLCHYTIRAARKQPLFAA